MERRFEWDPNKNEVNIRKHKLDFNNVLPVFDDPYQVVFADKCESEERRNIIGMVNKLLFVVYTEKEDDIIRIISARRATNKEARFYVHSNSKRGGYL